jgi:hypothetical protein
MKNIFFTTFLFFSLISLGQTSNDKVVYLDSKKIEVDSVNYFYKKVIKDYHLEKEIYKLEVFNNDSDLIYTEEISDKNLLIRNGLFTSYYANGNKIESGNYTNNLLSGKLTEWYENGNIKAEYFYTVKNNKPEKTVINYWNEDKNQTVKDGNGDYEFNIGFNDEEEIIIRGKVENGLLEGKWNTKTLDYPYFEEFYSKGKFLNGVKKYSNKQSVYYTEISIQAKPNDGMNEFRKLIGSQMKTKKQKSALEGAVVARFIIDTDGEIINPVIIKSLNSYFDNQLLDILNNTEKWKPGEYRGEKVKQYFTLPLTIKVEESK